MLKKNLLITASILALALPITAATIVSFPAPAIAQDRPASFADLVEKLSPAVVNISTTQKVKTAHGFVGNPFPNMPDAPELEPFRDFFERFGNPYGMEQQQDR